MECRNLLGTMLDAAAGLIPRSPEFERHLQTCRKCSERFDDLSTTMQLLDQWNAPEPSPHFDAVLRMKLLEAKGTPRRNWLSWFSFSAVAVSFAGLLFVGAVVFQRAFVGKDPASSRSELRGSQGTALEDLRSLDENSDIYDSDLLDELAVDQPNSTNSD